MEQKLVGWIIAIMGGYLVTILYQAVVLWRDKEIKRGFVTLTFILTRSSIVGYLERSIYMVALISKNPELVGVWLVLRAAANWGSHKQYFDKLFDFSNRDKKTTADWTFDLVNERDKIYNESKKLSYDWLIIVGLSLLSSVFGYWYGYIYAA